MVFSEESGSSLFPDSSITSKQSTKVFIWKDLNLMKKAAVLLGKSINAFLKKHGIKNIQYEI